MAVKGILNVSRPIRYESLVAASAGIFPNPKSVSAMKPRNRNITNDVNKVSKNKRTAIRDADW